MNPASQGLPLSEQAKQPKALVTAKAPKLAVLTDSFNSSALKIGIKPLQKRRSGIDGSFFEVGSFIASMASLLGVISLHLKKPTARLESRTDRLAQAEALHLINQELQAIKAALPTKPSTPKKPSVPISDRLMTVEHKLDDLQGDTNALHNKLDFVVRIIQLGQRSNFEHTQNIGSKRGGEPGFIQAYMKKNYAEAEIVTTQFNKIKERFLQVERLQENLGEPSVTTTVWTPLLQLMGGLNQQQIKNPAVVMLLLKEAETKLVEIVTPLIANSQNGDDTTFGFFLNLTENIALLHKIVEHYEKPSTVFTDDEQVLLLNEGFASHYAPAISQCSEHNFSLAFEMPSVVLNFYEVIQELHNGFLENSTQA